MNNKVLLGDVCEFLDHKRKPVTEGLRISGPYPYYGANGQQGWIDDFLFDEPLVLLAEDGGHFGSETKPIAYKIQGKTWVNNHAHVLNLGLTAISTISLTFSVFLMSPNLLTGARVQSTAAKAVFPWGSATPAQPRRVRQWWGKRSARALRV